MTVNELLDLYLDAGYARAEAADPLGRGIRERRRSALSIA
jgi:hypothetical protein